MRILITGSHSVFGPQLVHLLQQQGMDVVTWNRAAVSPLDASAGARFMAEVRPDGVFHLAVGPIAWAEQVAAHSHHLGAAFVFTSSVSVFSGRQAGPFGPEAIPEPDDDYGRYKRATEQAVLQAHPRACVVRLGWQIGEEPGSNTMLDYLEKTHARSGVISASVNWWQACSFVGDTAQALLEVLNLRASGIYHVDSNPGYTFHHIVTGLNQRHGGRWTVMTAEEPRLDNRLLETRLRVRPLSDYF